MILDSCFIFRNITIFIEEACQHITATAEVGILVVAAAITKVDTNLTLVAAYQVVTSLAAILAWATASWVTAEDNHLESYQVTAASLAALALAVASFTAEVGITAATEDILPFEVAAASLGAAVVGNHPFTIGDILLALVAVVVGIVVEGIAAAVGTAVVEGIAVVVACIKLVHNLVIEVGTVEVVVCSELVRTAVVGCDVE